jgi:lipid II:glycine glycyltransferase (peptidoglycan interpeptide bridge formation enzyme)
MHDIYFNKNNNGCDDTTFINFHSDHAPHPDYSNLNIMENLYPTIFSKYYENENFVIKFEPDIIKDYYLENKDNLEFYNTIDISRKYGMYEDFNCSIYFKLK